MDVCQFLVVSNADVTSRDRCRCVLQRCCLLQLTLFVAVAAALHSNSPFYSTRVTLLRSCAVSGRLNEQPLPRPAFFPPFASVLFSSCRVLESATRYDVDGWKEIWNPVPHDVDGCTGRMLEHSHANPQNTFHFTALSAACSVCLP